MPQERATSKQSLSIQDMLNEPYRDESLDTLRARFELEIDNLRPTTYGHYTPSQIKEHYDIEVELASRLMSAPKAKRAGLYTQLYDELFSRVPYHPGLARKSSPAGRIGAANQSLPFVERFLRPDSAYLEVGPGDCQLAFEVAKRVRSVYAVDVSTEVTRRSDTPSNFELIISDGTSVDVPEESIDIAFSDQLMEHLHPDDAEEQLRQIYRALKPGGYYLCVTPHRFLGPADVSRFFNESPKGFHLKEYTHSELRTLFRAAGFRRMQVPIEAKSMMLKISQFPSLITERLLDNLEHGKRRSLCSGRLIGRLISLRVIARK